ncbi:MAG: penicillin-binding protein 1C [Candidatus Eremiobacteraeota bacterium]|nr:penicillin-binding protein 1C [Candidatus Eremiobacteraeota bacterium]
MTLALGVCALLAYAERPLRPAAPHGTPRAVEFVDRHGLALGTIVRGERRAVDVPLSHISPAFVQAVLAAEDRRFYRHGALDSMSALRAVAQAAAEGRIPGGASTISMQVARMLLPTASGVRGKVEEIVAARRLENALSKRAILGAYCNLAPMGSNVYGVEAAALTYFGTDAAHLDLAQATLLAALPNDPVRLDPYRHWSALKTRQRTILAGMRDRGRISRDDATRAAAESVALRPRAQGIVAAPHYLFHLLGRLPANQARARTTIDRELQAYVATQVRDVLRTLSDRNVQHAAALVLDNRSGDVLAYVGSPDYFDDEHRGRNDGVQALRQPGSALKPFLYELALERRAVRPYTILADVPVAYALPEGRVYRPEDYSSRFFGPVRVRVALADSLNVPAVRVLERVGIEPFRARLLALGFAHLTKPAEYYGLGLTLGAGEVSLYELTRAYATMARDGLPIGGVNAVGDVASWRFVTDVLADAHARAASFGVESVLSLPFATAVKTGTSSDFRDTWTVGFSRDYTVGVWAGNFDGSPMRDVSGVAGAGPIWSRIMLGLHERREPVPFEAPARYVSRPMCAQTGTRPYDGCKAVVSELFDPADVATLERSRPVVATRARQYDEWLSHKPALRSEDGLRVLFPHEGDVFAYDPRGGASQRLQFEIGGARPATLRVTVDAQPIEPKGRDYLWTLAPGAHRLVVRSARGSATVRFAVIRPGPPPHAGFTFGS